MYVGLSWFGDLTYYTFSGADVSYLYQGQTSRGVPTLVTQSDHDALYRFPFTGREGARVELSGSLRFATPTGPASIDVTGSATAPLCAPPTPPTTTTQPAPVKSAAERAADEAQARVGQTSATADDAGLFPASEWSPGPYGEWAGDCPKLPYVAWFRATGGSVQLRRQNAITNYHWYNDRGLIQQGVPPIGAVTFYSATGANANLGHEALSIGGGRVATTQGLDSSGLPNTTAAYDAVGGGTYLGYYLPG